MVHLGIFVLCFTFTLWTDLVPFGTAAQTGVKVQVIGSRRPIVVALGDDVVLPCQLDPREDVQDKTVEWSKPDLKPDPSDRLSRVAYVHLYRDKREVPDMKIPSYAERTALFTDALRDGNISLKIVNATLGDTGPYRCYVPKLDCSSVVQLVVEPRSVKTSTAETPLHPKILETPAPNNETRVKGVHFDLSVLICGLFAGFLFILCFGVIKAPSKSQNQPAAVKHLVV
ncbi:selection and upkeep of intraepithelial T-cells protein 1 isoform X1 [Etheostoma spectabile]|uniref:selection and upkeep of intraepithelial T-cells protein 1 isoform X1 n=1 Tax=Etheostoma spectabile TaxID=54343 RepID=UPI0013AEA7DD|nr:selection and upkeep of intraepithelial T-cells protein 1-like isoform X1 [Etheostoma spectabile]